VSEDRHFRGHTAFVFGPADITPTKKQTSSAYYLIHAGSFLAFLSSILKTELVQKNKKKSLAFSPQANYTD
jgi:hypothetical protein